MHEYKWDLPAPDAQPVILRVNARASWFGGKSLTVGSQSIYRRHLLSGIEARIKAPSSGKRVELKLVPDGPERWRPVLLYGGEELPEKTGTVPPTVPMRPPVISIVTGFTYLLMLVAAVMMPSTVKMLSATRLPHNTSKFVMSVRDPAMPDILRIELPESTTVEQDKPFTAKISVSGGKPPYAFTPDKEAWPKGMTLDPATGEVGFTPRNRDDYLAVFTVRDAAQHCTAGVLAVDVVPTDAPPANWPKVTTTHLPDATYGEAYEHCFAVAEGEEPYAWRVLSGGLPSGLKLDKATGCVSGTPSRKRIALLPMSTSTLKAGPVDDALHAALADAKHRIGKDALLIPAGADTWLLADESGRLMLHNGDNGMEVLRGDDHYAMAIYVEDSSYEVGDDVRPWIIPFLVTTLCLVGYWNMRRWGVMLFAVLIAVELVLMFVAVPIAITALVLQGVLLLVGLAYVRQMA